MTSCFNEAMCTGVPDIFIWAIKQLTPTWLCRFIMYGLFANQKSTVISSHSRMASRMNPGSFMGTRACLGFLNLLCITVHLSTLNFVHHMSGHLQSNSKSLWNLSAAVLGLSISLSPSTLHGSYLHSRKQRRLVPSKTNFNTWPSWKRSFSIVLSSVLWTVTFSSLLTGILTTECGAEALQKVKLFQSHIFCAIMWAVRLSQ